MREIDLDSAIDEIIDASGDRSEKQSSGSRFFFVVGAGISFPVVPTALEIQHKCKEMALERKPFDEPDSDDAMRCYSYWFDAAFPQADQRTRYLKQLMHQKRISPANLRLAHLLQDGSVGNLVVTPNFDDFLARALLLFGASPRLCDHPGTIRRLDGNSSEIQILHVHGTYPFYDACNLDLEIKERARATTDDDSPTISSFLSSLLWQRSPIVIGYSGWERDVIMSALKARIHHQVLPVNLYWFCYDRHAITTLPDWLKEHGQVRFVVPDANNYGAYSQPSNTPLERTSKATLDAADVLTRFISKMGLQSPTLFHSPVKFFAQMLKRDIYSDEDSLQDHYHLRYLVTRVEAAAEWLESPEGYAKASPSDELVSKVLDANRRADPSAVIDTATHLLERDLTPIQRHGIVDALMSTVTQLSDDPTVCRQACDLVLQFTQGRDSCATCEIAHIHACFLKGEALSTLEEFDAAISEYDKCVEHAAVSHDVTHCPVLADALFCKARAFFQLGRSNDEIATYEELQNRCSNIPDPHLRQLLAKAQTNIGMALQGQGLDLKALDAFRQVIQEFGSDESEEISEPIAKSLVHTGLLLEGEDDKGALDAYNEVLKRFLNSPYEGVVDPVSKALANKARVLYRLNHSEEAKVCASDFLTRFGGTTDPELLLITAAMHQVRGRLLGTEGDHLSAIQDFDWIIEHLSSSTDHLAISEVALTWANRGVPLMLLGRHDEAGVSCEEVVKLARKFGFKVVGDVAVLTALRNRAIWAKERGQFEESLAAKQLLIELLRNSSDQSTKIAVASAMHDASYELLALERPGQALKSFADLIEYCGVTEDSELTEHAAHGFYGRAQALGTLGHVDEKLGSYSELIRHFSSSKNPRVIDIVARAIFSKGVVQRDDKHAAGDALNTFKELYLYCADHKTEATLLLRAKALFAQAQLYHDMREYELETKCCDEIVTLCQGHISPALVFQTAMALHYKSLTFFRTNEYGKIIADCNEAIKLLTPLQSDSECADLLAQCLLSKAHAFDQLGHYEDALEEVRAVPKVFETMESSNKVRLAQAGICEAHLHKRLKHWSNMRSVVEKIISTYSEESDTTIREYVEAAQSLRDQLNNQPGSPDSNS